MPRAALRRIRDYGRRGTAPLRMAPGYMIIGAQKAGTSSLNHFLGLHPAVARAAIKETNYFSFDSHKPWAACLSNYPLRRPGALLTGEASPIYLYHPAVPGRVAARLPDVKLIVMLREPGARALSHYHHERAKGHESESFEEALNREAERLAGERERELRDPRYQSYALRHYSYQDRGRYAEQLERWFSHFPREQFLIIESEAFNRDQRAEYARVLEFLGLEPFTPPVFERQNTRRYESMSAGARDRLNRYFAEPNQRLFALLGQTFPWPS